MGDENEVLPTKNRQYRFPTYTFLRIFIFLICCKVLINSKLFVWLAMVQYCKIF